MMLLMKASPIFSQMEETGGASPSEMFVPALFTEPALNLGLRNINDSLRNIPAFDTYCSWDTEKLFDPADNDELPLAWIS